MEARELFNKKPEIEEKKSMFGSSKKPPIVGPNYSQMSGEVNNASRRLRILEERYINLRKKTQLTEQNMLSTNKRLIGQIRDAFKEITGIRSELKKINDQVTMMSSELKDCANRNDLLTLDKYIGFWQPMNFLTEKEAKKLIEESRQR